MGAKKSGKNSTKCKEYKDENRAAKNKERNIARDARIKAKHVAKKIRRAS
jgi:hypothetical protein